MARFAGSIACFSPLVPDSIRKAWVENGGSLSTIQATSGKEGTRLFCYGRTDPWFLKLSQNAIAVFHAQWIANVVAEDFPLPIAPYVLNASRSTLLVQGVNKSCKLGKNEQNCPSDSKPAGIALVPSTPARQRADTPGSPPALPLLPMKRPYELLSEPQSELRPTKRPRQMPNFEGKITVSKIGYPENTDTRMQKIPQTIEKPEKPSKTNVPYINLLEVVQKKRKSSSILRYTPVPDIVASNVITLLFSVGEGDAPRISFSAACSALRPIQIENSCIMRAKRSHLDKRFQFMPDGQ